MSGGVENVFVENCQLKGGKRGLTFKCNLDRGGQVKRIFMRNIEIDSLGHAMFIFRMDYHGYRGNTFPTQFNDFYAGNIRCKNVDGPGLPARWGRSPTDQSYLSARYNDRPCRETERSATRDGCSNT